MNKKIIDYIRNGLLVFLPVVLFFSYHPVITIGTNDTMNLELSLPEIWLVLFSLICLPRIRALLKFYRKKKIILASIVPLFFSFSLIWSENKLRTILTAGMVWLVVFAILNIIYSIRKSKLEKSPRFGGLLNIMLTTLLISAMVMSIFCWIQSILDVIGISRDITLLCQGCVATAFGFPHPNGFAIEPQFMGNLLIAPVLLCFYLLCNFDKQKIIKNRVCLIVISVFLSSTLFFTFSRGAIYAVLLGFILELILLKKTNRSKVESRDIVSSLVIMASAFVISLFAQGVFAATGPTNDDFISGVTKSIHQLTLGKIDLRPIDKKEDETVESEQVSTKTEQTEQSFPQTESVFSGYVAESTNRRLDLNHFAFETWKSSPQYFWIGVGLGGAGIAMNKQFPNEVGTKEIVQNEYFSLLLEVGVVGCFLILIVSAVLVKKNLKYFISPLFCSVVFSFLLTLLFFSGLPNALQIYLLPVLLFFV